MNKLRVPKLSMPRPSVRPHKAERIVGLKIGGYVDAWRVAPDPGWTLFGTMRYRSRRDLMQLVTDPRFLAMHPFKLAGTAETFSFPTRPVLTLFAGPRLWVGLVIALVAALAQLAVLLWH